VKNNPPKTSRIRRNGPHMKFAKASIADSILINYISEILSEYNWFPNKVNDGPDDCGTRK
jgi:hypothetical protein